MPKLVQPRAITRNAVVGKVASKFLTQLLMLFRNRFVSVAAAPLRDPFESPSEALLGGFALDDPIPSTRLAPIVGEAQEVEGSRFAPAGDRRSPEGHQTGLVRMDRQAVLP